jgi:diguanylate cyclase (GGDEF)-like protein/PAS domain S-box-containing protein
MTNRRSPILRSPRRELRCEVAQHEQARRENEARFRSVAETASDAIICCDSQGAIVLWNNVAERMFGYPAAEAMGRPLTLIMPEGRRGQFQAAMARMMTAEKTSTTRSILDADGFRRDGSTFCAEISIATWTSGAETLFTAICRDVSARKHAEEILRDSEQRYRNLFDRIPVGLYRTSPEGEFLDVNPALVQMLGYPSRALLLAVRAAAVYANAEERQQWQSAIEHEIVVRNRETQARRYDGTIIWVRDSARAVHSEQGDVLYYEGSLEDITERKQAEDVLRSLSLKDDLTGLYNRRGFMFLAEQQLRIAHRLASTVVLLFVDLDGMKHINDTYGHAHGDRALIRTAGALRETFRESDILARLGGDEFAVLTLMTSADRLSVALLSARLRETLHHGGRENTPYQIALSIGASYYDPEAPCLIGELLERADNAMYEQKHSKTQARVAALPLRVAVAGA